MNWKDFEYEVAALVLKITYTPDCIVGIVRGGIIPSRILASKLSVKEMYCMSVKKVNGEKVIATEIIEQVKNKKILLVEDILETGESIKVVNKYLRDKGAEVKTASLYVMPQTKQLPDFYVKEVREIIRFPWE